MSAAKRAARRPALTYGDDQLHTLQRNTFRYFWEETNPENGLIPDHTSADIPATIAGVGLALASYPVAAERSFVPRAKAVERTLATLRFLWSAPQGPMPDATGHRGHFYHFLDVSTGRRAWRCELSTIDTTILIAGALTVAAYSHAELSVYRRGLAPCGVYGQLADLTSVQVRQWLECAAKPGRSERVIRDGCP